MKNLLMTTTLYLVLSISQAWSVPTCPGSPQTDGFLKNWNNCEGTYISTVDQSLGNGQNVASFNAGGKYVGEWHNNMPNGQGVLTIDGELYYAGNFKDDIPHGQGTRTFANGTKYVGEFKEDRFHGQGTFTYADGGIYVGGWKDNQRHGQGKLTKPNGKITEAVWENGNEILDPKKYWEAAILCYKYSEDSTIKKATGAYVEQLLNSVDAYKRGEEIEKYNIFTYSKTIVENLSCPEELFDR